jgi:hypothetical protein
MTILKETVLALLQLIFWTACFVAVLWSLTNAYVFVAVVAFVFVFAWIGIYG